MATCHTLRVASNRSTPVKKAWQMSKPPKQPNKHPIVSEADHKLWQEWARSLDPIRKSDRDGAHVPLHDAPALNEPQRPSKSSLPTQQPRAKSSASSRTKPDDVSLVPQSKLDTKTHRRLHSGRIGISGRLDLHGMRQDEAHRALRSFLLSAQARGYRWVLIITGKGGSDGPRSNHQSSFAAYEEQRGILRRNVPKWLSEPELSKIVVRYSTAGRQHGGEGALYVQLRTHKEKH